MGLFDYFSKDAAAARRRESCRKKLSNMYYQKTDRLAAAEIAADMARQGDDEALRILFVRFENKAQNQTIDQEEKGYVVDLLVGLGDRAVPTLIDYIKKTTYAVYWPLQVLDELWDRQRFAEFLAEVLEETDTGYWRDPEKKIGLIQLAETYQHDRLGNALVPFLEDHTEEIRFKAVDGLLRNDYAVAKDAIIARAASGEEEGNRVRVRIAEGLAQKAWNLGEHADAVAANLPAGFRVKDGVVVGP